jgi:hypothetical protein
MIECDELENLPLYINGYQIQRLKGIMYITEEEERLRLFNTLLSELLVERLDIFGREISINGLG